MFKNKKGFTLIELLAVIVILAIIALITVPVVIKIINNSKKGVAEDSTYNVIKAAELFWISNQMSFEDMNVIVTFIYDETEPAGWKTTISGSNAELLEISGTKPTAVDENSKIEINNGKVTVVGLRFGDYSCSKEQDEPKVVCTAIN